jgi:uncharacterized membrane protein SirB2
MWAGLRIGMTAPVRYLSYSIDTVLLTAALMLATMLHRAPFADAWLTTKIALVIAYIVLGSFALKRGPSRAWRRRFFLVALASFAVIYTVARSRGAGIWA